jgi:hypothetical protein
MKTVANGPAIVCYQNSGRHEVMILPWVDID